MKFKVEALIKSNLAPYVRMKQSFKSNFIPYVAFAALAFLAQPSMAQSKNISKEKKEVWLYKEASDSQMVNEKIHTIRDSKSAKVMFVYPIRTEPPRNEREFLEMACKYNANDARQIFALENIIKDSKLKVISNPQGPIVPVAAIYITLANGDEMKIIIDNNFVSTDAVVAGSLNNEYVILDSGILKKLYHWAVTTKTKTYCNDLINEEEKH